MAETMKEILVWKGKYSTEYWDATADLKPGAFLGLFQAIDTCGYYANLTVKEDLGKPAMPEGHPEGCRCGDCAEAKKAIQAFDGENKFAQQRALFRAAKAGDSTAAAKLVKLHRNYEYEEWFIERVNPPAGKVKE